MIEDPITIATAPPLPTIEGENQDKKTSDIPHTKSDSSAIEHEDEDVEELYLKQNKNNLQPNTGTNPPVLHGSTLSLDKDKMSVDSLDISNDRRNVSNNK
jgi:hypothetical protein